MDPACLLCLKNPTQAGKIVWIFPACLPVKCYEQKTELFYIIFLGSDNVDEVYDSQDANKKKESKKAQ